MDTLQEMSEIAAFTLILWCTYILNLIQLIVCIKFIRNISLRMKITYYASRLCIISFSLTRIIYSSINIILNDVDVPSVDIARVV